jgi:cyclopropane-fatty-acyl-phospholipid synthase
MTSQTIERASQQPRADLRGVPSKARLVLAMLHNLSVGELSVTLPGGKCVDFGQGHPKAQVKVNSWEVFDRALASGDIGFAESYMDGLFETDNLGRLLTLLNANRQAIDAALFGSWYGRLAYRIKHLLNRNTKTKARKNIQAHYDLGNSFYQEWLDSSMTYSAALFAGDEEKPLEAAQQVKIGRVFEELKLPAANSGSANVLEIGFGWGGFAEYAAQRGVKTTALTLSREQLVYATDRLQSQGLGSLAEFKLQDYRDEAAQYDGIASIEMFEAVGVEYWDDYFACLKRNLKPGGRACIQTITIDDALFERYRDGTDFIQQYIFPGGMLPSPARFEALAVKHGLQVENKLAFGNDYALTLRHWRQAFMAKEATVRAQGFDSRFVKMWEFYLAYCEAGFNTKSTDVIQYTLRNVATAQSTQ